MAGSSAEEVQPDVLRLPSTELQALLGTAILLREEVAAICLEPAAEIDRLIASTAPPSSLGPV